ncbi:hypothetical protein BDY19DRAFT_187944 [Irpex rosettiformis]|uniref:Uncharacterized protein n=1 Tax=Irpex rosettiformis TaxID=378272 RepID=A0ACB8U1S5_9APHY|nr:hypothetical protein BDY19DRAFT_187944 [Irpex rosettiformis]
MATDNSFCPLCTAKIAAAGRVYINPRAKRYEANICFVPDRDRVQNRDLSDNDMIYGPGLLRALHAIRDPRRYDVLQDMLLLINDWVRYYDDAGTWEQLEAKFCVELTNTLLEIVADLSAYTFDDDKGVSGPFLQNLFACLAISMDYYTMLSATDYLPNMNIESTSKKADRLFTFIWSHKGLLNRPHKEGSRSSESGSTWYLADYVLRVACGTRHIMHIRKDTTPSALITESRYYHILLYCWLGNQKYALDSHATTGLSLLSAYISYNEPHNSGKLMGSLVRSAITPDLAHSLTNKVSMMLADPTLSSQTLHNLLAISSSLLLECQQFLNPSSDEALERLMNNWCAVVERNICLGGLLVEERAAPNRHGQDGLIMAMGWKVIGETIEQRSYRS